MPDKPTVTAGDLRDWYNADPKRIERLPEVARKSVTQVDGKNPRGRVHPLASKDHNRRRKVQYVTGATNDARAQAKADALALREALRAAGVPVKDNGRLPKGAAESLKG